MLKKNLILGSVASLALAVAASSAFAQSPPQYPDQSLPWEYAQTAQLNAQQAAEPGIIASNTVVTPDTTAIVASNSSAADIAAYNQALAAQQASAAKAASDQAQYQQSWNDYQQKLSDYNAKMQTYRSSMVVASAAPVMSSTVVTSSSPVVTGEVIGQPVVRERIIHRPVVAQETVTRPVTRWETVTRPVVREETVTRPVVTQETFTHPVVRDQIVREQVIDRPIIRSEVIGTRETVVAENTPATDEWVRIYPHHERLVVFETISTPETSLRGAQVMDASGQIVGKFRHMTTQDGVSEAVVMLNDMKTIAIPDHNLRYDPMANVVVADLSYSQMASMPAFG